MYRETRRKDRVIGDNEAMDILINGEYGFLSTVGADGQPYAVPISYVVIENYIYCHCAKSGQKIDNMAHEPRVCFCVVGMTQPIYDKDFTTYYESAMVYGVVSSVEEEGEKTDALMRLCKKYLPAHMDKAPESIKGSISRTHVFRISMDHITGKAKRK